MHCCVDVFLFELNHIPICIEELRGGRFKYQVYALPIYQPHLSIPLSSYPLNPHHQHALKTLIKPSANPPSPTHTLLPPSLTDEISTAGRDLLRQLLHIDPLQRMTAGAAMRHPWLAKQFAQAGDMNKLRLETTILISDRPTDDIDDQVGCFFNTYSQYTLSIRPILIHPLSTPPLSQNTPSQHTPSQLTFSNFPLVISTIRCWPNWRPLVFLVTR